MFAEENLSKGERYQVMLHSRTPYFAVVKMLRVGVRDKSGRSWNLAVLEQDSETLLSGGDPRMFDGSQAVVPITSPEGEYFNIERGQRSRTYRVDASRIRRVWTDEIERAYLLQAYRDLTSRAEERLKRSEELRRQAREMRRKAKRARRLAECSRH